MCTESVSVPRFEALREGFARMGGKSCAWFFSMNFHILYKFYSHYAYIYVLLDFVSIFIIGPLETEVSLRRDGY